MALARARRQLETVLQETLGETDRRRPRRRRRYRCPFGRRTATLNAAEAHNCDHIFIAGRRRSPTGKAIFGDWVQRVLLNFDGLVTVSLDEEGESPETDS